MFNIICFLFGHRLRYDKNIYGDPLHCTRCLKSLNNKWRRYGL